MIEIILDKEHAISFLGGKQQELIDAIANKLDHVNAMCVDRIRGNLLGGVLESRSGKLAGSLLQIPAQISGSEIYGGVEAGGDEAPYGIYFEKGGTHWYEIRPVEASVLAFMSEGQKIFAKVVNHPPIPHLPWFGPEVEVAQGQMNDALAEAFREVLE